MNHKLRTQIGNDISQCRNHTEVNGSERLYGELVAKYSIIIPDFEKHLSTNGKAAVVGREFDYRPELNAIAAKLEIFLLTEGDSGPRLQDLVDQIPEVQKAFFDAGGGYRVVFNTPVFTKWKEAVKFELRRLRQDVVIEETIQALDRFNGWNDEKLFGEVSAKCQLILEHLDDYQTNSRDEKLPKDMKKVFIVHGHDINTRDDVELFLRRLKLEPIILANEANLGQTVIEKFESNSDVSFAIVLYTACDEGRVKGNDCWADRARQNVVFEHGYFSAKLGRKNVVALHEPGVEIPSDLSGILYISLASDWKTAIKKEMKAAGLDADWSQG